MDVLTPQEAMANSECIAAAYEGFTKNVDKLQKVMTKGQEMEEKVKQRRSKVGEEIKGAFQKFDVSWKRGRKLFLMMAPAQQ